MQSRWIRFVNLTSVWVGVITPLCSFANNPSDTLVLSRASQVLELSFHEAGSRMPVVLEGVVTVAESDWHGQFFIQDESGGVFVENLSDEYPRSGDWIRLEGETHPGAFAPIVSKPKWVKLGEKPLPKGIDVRIDDLMLGVHDGKRVNVEGMVRSAWREGPRIWTYLGLGGYRLEVSLPGSIAANPESLLGATIKVEGTTATHYNSKLRSLTAVAVYVPSESDVEFLSREPDNPFEKPVIPLEHVAQYRPRSSSGSQRIHLEGAVTHQSPGNFLFIEDDTAGIKIETRDPTVFKMGSIVSVIGFLEFEQHLPLIKDGVLRATGEFRSVEPLVVSAFDELAGGRHHAELLVLEGQLIDKLNRPLDPVDSMDNGGLSLILSNEGFRFTVECDEGVVATGESNVLPLGSELRVSGVGIAQVDVNGVLKSMVIRVNDFEDIQVLKKPSWWTPRRLLVGALILAALLAVALAWTFSVSAKNRMLKFLLKERERSQHLLQDAHDHLEQKVEERTRQLQVAMTAKKQAEVEHKAILSERTRLARDLHDTLEQTLTGIALRLGIAAKSFSKKPDSAIEHVVMARKWLSQSQEQLRHSIWDLRSRELHQFNLQQALRQIAETAIAGTGIALDVDCSGSGCELSEVQEDNLLRIGQEAITNTIKHSGAEHLNISIQCHPELFVLIVEDDGSGFEPPPDFSHFTHHFGLLGMHERIQRIGGNLTIESETAIGTKVKIQVKTGNEVCV